MKCSWPELLESVSQCEKCGLCKTRKNVVPGEGNPSANLMFIGEGPGRDEDETGRPFVGVSGQLLTQMIHAMGMERTDVYICNIVKCRPPANRNPEPAEAAACMDYLRAQFLLVRPKVVVLLGKVAAKYILGEDVSIGKVHGQVYMKKNVAFVPTYHPSALLRDPSKKRDAWEDFKRVKALLTANE